MFTISRSKGMKKYEKIVCEICHIKELKDGISWVEMEQALGVAMVLSYIKGIKPTPPSFAAHLDVPTSFLEDAYSRLRDNGVFDEQYNAREDKVLKGGNQNLIKSQFISSRHLTEISWCHLAAIACGMIGKRNEADIDKFS